MGSQVNEFGTSAAAMIERHLSFVVKRFKVDVQDGDDALIADINRLSSGLRLTVEPGVKREQQLEVVAIQLGYEALNFQRPIRALAMYSDKDREEYSRVLEWAAWVLIPDQAVIEAQQCEWTAVRLAYECGVSVRMAKVRIHWWKKPRREKPAAGKVVQLRPPPPLEEPPGIRYVPGKQMPWLDVPHPEDRAKALKEITERLRE